MGKSIKYLSGRWAIILVAGFLVILMAGCSQSNQGMQNLDYEPFVAPSLAPTIPPTAKPKNTAKPENTPVSGMEVASSSGCTDNLVFIQDLTIPDGTVVVAGSTLDKQWEVRNSGSCDWNESYTFQLEEGISLNSDSQLQMPVTEAGNTVTIRMVLTAPDTAGSYLSAWQAYNPDGTAFGDLIYVDFTVQ